MDVKMKESVERVKRHAKEFYNGWDMIVECCSDDDLADMIANSLFPERLNHDDPAVSAVHQIAKLWDDRRQEVRAEIF